MIVLVLILILIGSLSGASAMWLRDATFWQILLGYVAGGWAGLILGLPFCVLIQSLIRWRRPRLSLDLRKRQSQS